MSIPTACWSVRAEYDELLEHVVDHRRFVEARALGRVLPLVEPAHPRVLDAREAGDGAVSLSPSASPKGSMVACVSPASSPPDAMFAFVYLK